MPNFNCPNIFHKYACSDCGYCPECHEEEIKKKIKVKLEKIVNEIKVEIMTRPKAPNIGKKGCVRRLEELIDAL